MNKDQFVILQNSPENLKARDDNIKKMSKLIASQSELCKIYNLQKKERLQAKYLETKKRLNVQPRIFKSVG